ncbi:MAG: c-type cytochrome biogenesis protein CcmI [Caulobacteraceae bacterium]
MLLFWVVAAVLSAGAAVLIMFRGGRAPFAIGPEDPALAVYRRALTEIDELAERSLLGGGERRSARAEAARRLLAQADRPVEARRGADPRLLAALGAAPVLAALMLYLAIGSPGEPDQPFASRLAQWRDHPELDTGPQMAAALRSFAAQRPADPEPLRRLAMLDIELGDPDGAVHALRKALAIAPQRPDLMAPLGEILVLQNKGVVDPNAQALFEKLVRLDPTDAAARYYLARSQIAHGDLAGGLAGWRGLESFLANADPRRALLAAEIAEVERTGALPPQGGPAPAGPSPAMSAAIRGMVDGLAQRLAAHPNDPDGWVRLVRAYAVLGEIPQRDAAAARARRLFAARPGILDQLSAAMSPPS